MFGNKTETNDKAVASPRLLSHENSTLVFIDHQPQMFFALDSHDSRTVLNNLEILAKTSKIWDVPVVLTSIVTDTFTGTTVPQLTDTLGPSKLERTSINAWEDAAFVNAVEETGRKKLVIAGMWTELCLLLPVLSAIDAGYEVYFVSDASGGMTPEAHEMAVHRMIQAGATPVTAMQVLLEYQRDWGRQETYKQVTDIIKEHGGAYGIGTLYVEDLPKEAVKEQS